MSAEASRDGSDGRADGKADGQASGPRDALTRVLAIESRNALARVELAASELARGELTPSIRERVDTIRSATSDIDALLGKIDRLVSPRAIGRWPAVDVASIFRRVETRLAPTLRALGVTLDWADEAAGAPAEKSANDYTDERAQVRIEIPEASLERLWVGFLRLGLSWAGRGGRLSLRMVSADGLIAISLERQGEVLQPMTGVLTREAQVEFEVQLAEWGGSLVREADAGRRRLAFVLPVEAVHA